MINSMLLSDATARSSARVAAAHNGRHMLLVERVNFMHLITEQPGNDAACARTEDQIKALADWLPDHRLDFFQHSQRVKALSSPAIQ